MYNKEAIYRYRENNLAEYKIITQKAAAKWRENNSERVKMNDKLRKTPLMIEWRILRNISLF